MKNTYSYLSDARKLEFHYTFEDNSHTMNAFVFNNCEKEILNIITDIATTFKVAIDVEVEPLEDGSLISRLKIKARDFKISNNSKNELRQAIIIGIFGLIFIEPGTLFLTEAIDNLFNEEENKLNTELLKLSVEEKKINIEKKQIELAQLKEETQKKVSNLDQNKLAKRRSNFYESLSKEKKVTSISLSIKSEDSLHTFETYQLERSHFDNFIITSNDLESIFEDNANIEIIAPILKKGNKYKWKGIYEGQVIEFSMKSNEFKNLVQTGAVEFKNGFTINCHLEIHKKQTNEEDGYISGYEVLLVNSYTINEIPTETPEGKKHKGKREAEQKQLSLFDGLD